MIDFKYGVTLNTLDESLMGQLRSWRNNPEIRKWCRQSDLITERDQDNWYVSLSGSGRNRMYAITSGSGKVVGVCGLTDIDWVASRAEFSCYVAPEHQKCGYATAALKTLFLHGFENLNLHIIWGETFEGNPALDLFIKLGMKVEGVRREFYYKGGKYIDATLISIKREECEF